MSEGVETEDQRQTLLDLQCDELQGFLLARPMDVAAFGNWMQKQATSDGQQRPAPAGEPTPGQPAQAVSGQPEVPVAQPATMQQPEPATRLEQPVPTV